MRKSRDRYQMERTRDMLEQYIEQLEKSISLDKAGDKDASDRVIQEVRMSIETKIAELEKEEGIHNRKKVFDRSVLPAQGELLGESDGIKLIAFDESYRELYLKTEEEEAILKSSFQKSEFCDLMWKECMKDTALCYAVIDAYDHAYCGYVAIKDTSQQVWELALMLLREYRYKGIAKKALTILFRELQSRTGRWVFRARVDIVYYSSQALMDKIGARTNGVSEFMLHGEDLENFKKENLSMIDDQLIKVADKFGVDAEDLLGQVLEYLIER